MPREIACRMVLECRSTSTAPSSPSLLPQALPPPRLHRSCLHRHIHSPHARIPSWSSPTASTRTYAKTTQGASASYTPKSCRGSTTSRARNRNGRSGPPSSGTRNSNLPPWGWRASAGATPPCFRASTPRASGTTRRASRSTAKTASSSRNVTASPSIRRSPTWPGNAAPSRETHCTWISGGSSPIPSRSISACRAVPTSSRRNTTTRT